MLTTVPSAAGLLLVLICSCGSSARPEPQSPQDAVAQRTADLERQRELENQAWSQSRFVAELQRRNSLSPSAAAGAPRTVRRP
jgi:hypothetical protein